MENFSLIKNQYLAKRAIEIAVAGQHSMLMLGSPGMGKTTLIDLANRLNKNLGESRKIKFIDAINSTAFNNIIEYLHDFGHKCIIAMDTHKNEKYNQQDHYDHYMKIIEISKQVDIVINIEPKIESFIQPIKSESTEQIAVRIEKKYPTLERIHVQKKLEVINQKQYQDIIKFLNYAILKYGLSYKQQVSVIELAYTISKLDGISEIEQCHINEAINLLNKPGRIDTKYINKKD